MSKEDGVLFNKLFGIRQDADYEDFFEMMEEDIKSLFPKVAELINDVEDLINEGK